MRLDKFFSAVGLLSRRECAAAVKHGEVTVNGRVASRPDMAIDPEADTVAYLGDTVAYRPFVYLWLNKPAGYVSATEDGHYPTVTELAPARYARLSLFPCGRLDRDTVGLLLLTNDGALSHALLSPRRGVSKIYRFLTEHPLPPNAEARLAAGLATEGGTLFRPADLALGPDRTEGEITLTEGKYHEVKRMLAALGAPLTFLERVAFAGVRLPADLARGETRPVSDEELALLRAAALPKSQP